jgi:hypothetical protein
MTDQHRATPEQWEHVEKFVEDCGYDSCLLELRDRIEQLEANQFRGAAEMVAPSAPADSLVERVASICASGSDDEPEVWKPEARAAIREVARWLRSELVSRAVADRLDQEANR